MTITAGEIAQLKRFHRTGQRVTHIDGETVQYCAGCDAPWPCDMARLLAEVERGALAVAYCEARITKTQLGLHGIQGVEPERYETWRTQYEAACVAEMQAWDAYRATTSADSSARNTG